MMALDDEIRRVHESYWDAEVQAARGKSVVLVEGEDDREVIEEIFRQRSRSWETRVRIVVAGGRARVLERIRATFPQAWGLLSDQREQWIRAGALWWALQRTREAQQRWQEALGWSESYGSPRADLELTSGPDLIKSLRQRIPEALLREANFEIQEVAERFERRLGEVLGTDEVEQWRSGVHGKCAFMRLLVPGLQATHGQRNWRRALACEVGRPPPFDELMAMLFPGG